MIHTDNNVCKSLWLKRNPIGPEGCKPLANLLSINKTLVLLDLHNCGILDEGLIELSKANECVLKHLYVDANGITSVGAIHISEWLKKHKNVIKTFYISINRIQDSGAIAITNALKDSSSLRSLCLASNRLTDLALPVIVNNMLTCKNLICLDLGFYKSTFDLGEKPNYFSNINPLKILLNEHHSLQHLDVNMNRFEDKDIIELIDLSKQKDITITATKIIDGNIYDESINKSKYNYLSPKHNKSHGLKFIKHPKKVINIMSMYRNKI